MLARILNLIAALCWTVVLVLNIQMCLEHPKMYYIIGIILDVLLIIIYSTLAIITKDK